MCKCDNCGAIFWEDEAGVINYDPASGMFEQPMCERWACCPDCGSTEVDWNFQNIEDAFIDEPPF